jgi:hypothetical protein
VADLRERHRDGDVSRLRLAWCARAKNLALKPTSFTPHGATRHGDPEAPRAKRTTHQHDRVQLSPSMIASKNATSAAFFVDP